MNLMYYIYNLTLYSNTSVGAFHNQWQRVKNIQAISHHTCQGKKFIFKNFTINKNPNESQAYKKEGTPSYKLFPFF